MESADGVRGRDQGSMRRSPLGAIMNQIRRKRSVTDRKPLVRFLSWGSERIPEDGESAVAVAAEGERELGWGRVRLFLHRLGKTADSRSLSLAHCDLTATDLLELGTLLQFLPQLEELDISWNELIGGCLPALTSHLRLLGGIRALRLCSCRLSADDLSALGDALGCSALLEILDLSWNTGVGGALQSLLGKLQPSLRELHLVDCRLSASDAAALGGMVSVLPSLCVLDLSCNPQLSQDVAAFSQFAAALSQAASITTLRLHACGLTADSVDALGGALCRLPSVRHLDLSGNKGLSGTLERLCPHLAHLGQLESLELHLCCLTHCDLSALSQVLPQLKALTALDASSNKAAGGVVRSLVSALPLAQMRQLPLSSCSLNEESFTALTLAVPHLRSVDLSWSKVVSGRLPLLLDALQPSVILELRLCSCELTSSDLCHLAVSCQRGCLASLRLLDLSYNGPLADDGWSTLFGAAATGGGLGSLEDLDVSLRPSTSASCSAWLPALLRCVAGLPALTRLALQRWGGGPEERQRLGHALRGRCVLLEWDLDPPPGLKAANQESRPEE
ncbi:leucine-rich repeat-containing protein 31 [Nelusetta ayraudi]|uniref:leucine-rich repeat-containing protein 31 n=1 Tax=Nelusetta ayraudi TaxID=303726 RepID=UPI003F71B670